FACCLNKVRSGFPRLHEHWMPAGACPERSRRAGMTSFPRKRESRTMRRRNYAQASDEAKRNLKIGTEKQASRRGESCIRPVVITPLLGRPQGSPLHQGAHVV